jgi:hypothetical protein
MLSFDIRLDLPGGFLPARLHTKTLYALFIFMRATCLHPILLELVILIIFITIFRYSAVGIATGYGLDD